MSSILTLQGGEGAVEASTSRILGISAIRLKCWAPDLLAAINWPAPGIAIDLVENQPRQITIDPSGEQGGFHVLVTLEGHESPKTAEGEEYSLDGSTEEDDIDTHPLLQLLKDLYGGGPVDGHTVWPETFDTEEDGEKRNPMHGVQSYLVPTLIWTRRRVASKLDVDVYRDLAAIGTPPGSPPPLTGRGVWIKLRAQAKWRGNVWEIEESWKSTGPHGIAPELYRGSSGV